MAEETGSDVAVKIAGQEINVKNVKSLNTLATVATLIVCICGGYTLWLNQAAHAKDAQEGNRIQTTATTDNTRALREMAGELKVQNCFATLSPEQKKSPETIAFCKSLATVR